MGHQKQSLKQIIRKSPLLLLIIVGGLSLFLGIIGAQNFHIRPSVPVSLGEKVTVCFTPNGQCQALILQAIDQAQFSLKMQTYSFTSQDIADALLRAQKRGVNIQILSDRSQLTAKYSQIPKLKDLHVPILIDRVPGIAHNKIMIIDEHLVLTGSYNWTNAAEYRNAENLLLIQDPAIAAYYLNNWNQRIEGASKVNSKGRA